MYPTYLRLIIDMVCEKLYNGSRGGEAIHMTDIVLLTLISFSWIIFSWLVIYFHRKLKWYILPYTVFQLGSTLIVYSIAFVKGWAGIGYGSIGLFVIGISLFLLIIVMISYRTNSHSVEDKPKQMYIKKS